MTKSGLNGRLLWYALWTARSQHRTQPVRGMTVVNPPNDTAKGCPARVVLVKRQSPRRAFDAKLKLETSVLCRSANLNEAHVAKRYPPSSNVSQSSVFCSMIFSSHLTRIAKGIGNASLRSLGLPVPLRKLLIKKVLSSFWRSSIRAVLANHLSPLRSRGGCSLIAWASARDASFAICKIETRWEMVSSCQVTPICLIHVMVVSIAREYKSSVLGPTCDKSWRITVPKVDWCANSAKIHEHGPICKIYWDSHLSYWTFVDCQCCKAVWNEPLECLQISGGVVLGCTKSCTCPDVSSGGINVICDGSSIEVSSLEASERLLGGGRGGGNGYGLELNLGKAWRGLSPTAGGDGPPTCKEGNLARGLLAGFPFGFINPKIGTKTSLEKPMRNKFVGASGQPKMQRAI